MKSGGKEDVRGFYKYYRVPGGKWQRSIDLLSFAGPRRSVELFHVPPQMNRLFATVIAFLAGIGFFASV